MKDCPESQGAFGQFLQRGEISRHPVTLPNGRSALKRFLFVNHDCFAEMTYCLMITSQREYFERCPSDLARCVELPSGTLPTFNRDAIIDCRQIWPFQRATLYGYFLRGKAEPLGSLPPDLLREVDNRISESRTIERRFKKLILGV